MKHFSSVLAVSPAPGGFTASPRRRESVALANVPETLPGPVLVEVGAETPAVARP